MRVKRDYSMKLCPPYERYLFQVQQIRLLHFRTNPRGHKSVASINSNKKFLLER